ncbi:class I SAM-dependent methyltransferase [Halomonas sp. MCCC 1A17488]|uniref:class I SAM-dependent methyltransferase n=1 Tax=unclassified Halomonas TaxID=2609666 RepID=UPI0018D20357|nr:MULTISPECIES: class I SAM-dependent methyltransferase [unclassified Halomonas]MCE8016137.1 class I SAM-dependent methyltransferase [Halomonas sp. MCCC 1A17488]MCG3239470.1 class I SAM-dependent methyltransferase [Halomonas sp. MCCC 1A17488]QPP50605.1 class I SAM-dependent methyltransferase [Halomonas sp. SS10-MC5]
MKNARAFWNRSAARYAKSPIRNVSAYQKKLAITQEYLRPDSAVLEFGCGTGSTAILHAPHVRDLVAIDISDKMLEIAEQKARDAGVENISFRRGTLQEVELAEASFDVVLGLNILHLLEDLEATLARVHSLLKPGGVFVSSTVLIGDINVLFRMAIPPMQLLGLAPYVNRFGKQALVDKLDSAGFSIEREWQPGKGTVFIVAKKGSDAGLQ